MSNNIQESNQDSAARYTETPKQAKPPEGARYVNYARFQTPMHHPACGSFGDVLPSLTKTYADLTMRESRYGLEVSIKNRTIVIPWANVSGYEASDTNPSPLNMREFQK